MSERPIVLQDLIEPARAGFWGSTEKVSSRQIQCRVVRNGDVAKNGYVPRSQLPIRWYTPGELEKAQVKDGDVVLVSSGAYTGNAGIIAESNDGLPVIASNFVRRLRPQPKVDSGWFFHLIRSHVVQKYVPAHTGGSAIPNLSSTLYRKCPIPFVPDDKSQCRIAKILSTVDEAIEQTETLIAKYQQIKAGLMDDIFTRGITSDGHLRPIRTQAPNFYKESSLGWIPKEWEAVSAGQLCHLITKGTTPTRFMEQEESWSVPYIRVQNLTFDGSLAFNEDRVFISSAVSRGELGRSQVLPSDILMNIVGPPLGKVSVVPDNYPKWNINQAIAIFRTIIRENTKYLSLYLLSNIAQTWFFRRAKQTSGQVNLTLEMCRDLPVPLPRSPEEKDAISFCLLSVDDRMRSEILLLNKLKTLKHGLMHDLLTGRVRVKVGEPANT